MIDIYKEKAELRRACRKKRNSIEKEEKARLDEAICNEIISSPEFSSSSVILAYFPVGSEIDILPVVEYARKKGKRVAFPVCIGRDMIFRYVDKVDEKEDFEAGEYGIPAPKKECEEYKNSEDTFCIVPALALDKKGNRIGYGGGYYDKFLSGFSGKSAAVVYEELFFEEIVHNEYDVKIGVIITEKGRKTTV